MATMTAFVSGSKVQVAPQRTTRSRAAVRCMASSQEAGSRRQLLGFGAALLAAAVVAPAAKADLVSDLLAKSEANKSDNDKKRLLASYANLQRTRTVKDGSCAVPYNFLGCGENAAFVKVRFIADDLEARSRK